MPINGIAQAGRGGAMVQKAKHEVSRDEVLVHDKFKLQFHDCYWEVKAVMDAVQQKTVEMAKPAHLQHIRSRLTSQAICGNRLAFKLGKGGFSNVFLGAAANGKLIAAKVLHLERNRESFLKEAQLMCELHGKGRSVPALLGWFCGPMTHSHKQLGLVMEYFPTTISQRMEMECAPGRTPMSLRSKLNISQGLCSALHSINEVDHISHKDMKPDNVALTPDHKVLVNDFGLSERLDIELPLGLWKKELEAAGMVACWVAPETYVAASNGEGGQCIATSNSDLVGFAWVCVCLFFHEVYKQWFKKSTNTCAQLPNLKAALVKCVGQHNNLQERICLLAVIDVICSCWVESLHDRATFSSVVAGLKTVPIPRFKRCREDDGIGDSSHHIGPRSRLQQVELKIQKALLGLNSGAERVELLQSLLSQHMCDP